MTLYDDCRVKHGECASFNFFSLPREFSQQIIHIKYAINRITVLKSDKPSTFELDFIDKKIRHNFLSFSECAENIGITLPFAMESSFLDTQQIRLRMDELNDIFFALLRKNYPLLGHKLIEAQEESEQLTNWYEPLFTKYFWRILQKTEKNAAAMIIEVNFVGRFLHMTS